MIVVDRKTGKVLHSDPVSDEDRERAWKAVVQNYVPRLIMQHFPALNKQTAQGYASND